MPPNFPNFYVMRAHRAFLNAYGEDPNVIRAETRDDDVLVTVLDLDGSIFPVHIDGIPLTFQMETPLEEAS